MNVTYSTDDDIRIQLYLGTVTSLPTVYFRNTQVINFDTTRTHTRVYLLPDVNASFTCTAIFSHPLRILTAKISVLKLQCFYTRTPTILHSRTKFAPSHQLVCIQTLTMIAATHHALFHEKQRHPSSQQSVHPIINEKAGLHSHGM